MLLELIKELQALEEFQVTIGYYDIGMITHSCGVVDIAMQKDELTIIDLITLALSHKKDCPR